MSRTMELGELIGAFKKLDLTLPVYFDNGEHPVYIDSWRGIYSELALSHTTEGDALSGAEILHVLKAANGQIFCGYKGGDYEMDLGTPVWVDNCGCYSCNAIQGVKQVTGRIVIQTKIEDD